MEWSARGHARQEQCIFDRPLSLVLWQGVIFSLGRQAADRIFEVKSDPYRSDLARHHRHNFRGQLSPEVCGLLAFRFLSFLANSTNCLCRSARIFALRRWGFAGHVFRMPLPFPIRNASSGNNLRAAAAVDRLKSKSHFAIDPASGALVISPDLDLKNCTALWCEARPIQRRLLLRQFRFEIEYLTLKSRYTVLRGLCNFHRYVGYLGMIG